MKPKTNGTFKLSKSVKRVMATMIDREKASHYKNMMIDAELAETKAKMAKIKVKAD